MDPRDRADAALARARARGAFVVTPDDAVSPMDASNTLQIPRSVVHAADQPDTTMVIPGGLAMGQRPPQNGPQQRDQHWEQNQQQHRDQQQRDQQHRDQQQREQQQRPQGGPPPQQHPQPGYPQQHGHNSGRHQPVSYPQQQPPQQPQRQQPPPQPAPQQQPQLQPQAQQVRPEQYEDAPTPRQLDGLVPTTQHTQRSSMSRRLDGQ